MILLASILICLLITNIGSLYVMSAEVSLNVYIVGVLVSFLVFLVIITIEHVRWSNSITIAR